MKLLAGGGEKQMGSDDEVVGCIGERKVSAGGWLAGGATGRLSGDEEYGMPSRTLNEIFKAALVPTRKAKV